MCDIDVFATRKTIMVHVDTASSLRSQDEPANESPDRATGASAHHTGDSMNRLQNSNAFRDVLNYFNGEGADGQDSSSDDEPTFVPHQEVEVLITFEQREWASGDYELENEDSATTPWPPASLPYSCQPDISLSELVDECRDELDYRIRQHDTLAYALDDRKLKVAFLASVPAPDTPGAHVSLSDDRLNVSTLADLFKDPLVKNTLKVHLVFAVEQVKVAIPVEEPLIYMPVLSPYNVFRIGNAVDQSAESKKSKKSTGHSTKSSSKQSAQDVKGVRSIRPLLAWRTMKGSKMTTDLFSVPAYEFDGYCIGEAQNDILYWDQAFHVRHELLGRYHGLKSRKVLEEAIAVYDEEESPEAIGSGVPFLPSYCFNQLDGSNQDQKDFGLKHETIDRKDKIDIAVRCVSHLEPRKRSKIAGPEFICFPDILLSIPVTSTAKTVSHEVGKILKASKDTTNMGWMSSKHLLSSSVLWENPFLNKWAVQVWVSPQKINGEDEDRKMYCITRAEGQMVPLWLFLNTNLWKNDDRTLYLEVHIVPKDLDAWTVTGTMVKAPAPATNADKKSLKSSAATEEEQEDTVQDPVDDTSEKSRNEARIEEQRPQSDETQDDNPVADPLQAASTRRGSPPGLTLPPPGAPPSVPLPQGYLDLLARRAADAAEDNKTLFMTSIPDEPLSETDLAPRDTNENGRIAAQLAAKIAEQQSSAKATATATAAASTAAAGLASLAGVEGLASAYDDEDKLGEDDMVESADEELSSEGEQEEGED